LVKIRLASEEDISQIIEIEQEANMPPWTHGALLSELYNDESFFIVAVKDTTEPSPCVGFALMRQVGDDGELLMIAVDNTKRRKGISDLLMNAVLDEAKCNAFPSVILEVRSGNTAAIRLYEKHGFKIIRTRKDYYTNPIEDAVIMVKPV